MSSTISEAQDSYPVSLIMPVQEEHRIRILCYSSGATKSVHSAKSVVNISLMAKVEIMSPVDVAWLSMEEPTNLMMVNAVITFDRPLDVARVRQVLEVL